VANIKATCEFLSVLIDQYGSDQFVLPPIIEFTTTSAGNPNPQVRTGATQLVKTLYKHMGEEIRPYLSNVKDSTLKLFEEEFGKT
jgi:hypothetical protein